MPDQSEQARRFLELHQSEHPLLLPNPWDAGSARLLASLGFKALATTSGGFAATLGRLDGNVTREEAVAHSRAIVQATDLPVSADLENGFGDDPQDVAQTVSDALAAGLAGCSIEDSNPKHATQPIYDLDHAVERVQAAVQAAHAGSTHLVLTARAENYLHGRPDLGDTITRLQAFEQAGADVLYAPGLTAMSDIREVLASITKPLNVLARPGAPTVPELADAGVSRVSVGSAFAFAALAALQQAAGELQGPGTYTFLEQSAVGSAAARSSFQV